MTNLFDLNNKVAFITGGSSGLGVQFAKALAQFGADIVIVARRKEKLDKVAEEIRSMGRKCLDVKCDVTDEAEVEAAVSEAIKTFGKIDILVNNAGVSTGAPVQDLSLDDWNKVINTNLTGVFLAAKHVGKHMIEKKYGRIINIASMYGMVGNTVLPASPYHASKGAVVNFTRALAAEWAKYGITVNAVGPGFFESEMTDEVLEQQDFLNYIKMSTPLGRYGKEGELDGVIVYLASDSSSYTTGQTICVDGGTTAI